MVPRGSWFGSVLVAIACVSGCGKGQGSAPTAAGTSPSAAPVEAASGAKLAPAAPAEAPSESPAAAPETASTFAVFGVMPDDVLNVRAEADAKSKKVYSFGPSVTKVRATGKSQDKSGTKWVEVAFDGGTGWVNRGFLVEMHPGGGCNDAALTATIRKFMRAVSESDGAAFQELVSPVHGLLVHNGAVNPRVRIAPNEAGGVFSGGAVKDWGGGDNAAGPFKTRVLPSLREAVAGKGAKEKCGKLDAADGAKLDWPIDMSELTLVSFSQAGPTPASSHPSVIGMEYVEGKPYVAALIVYY